MDSIRIRGGRALRGTVSADGSKNAALPCLAASLLTDSQLELENVPAVQDIRTMVRVLQHLGGEGELGPGAGEDTAARAWVRSRSESLHEVPYEIVKTMRASAMVLGPLLARRGKARVSLPGGCAIGARPMDLHVTALEALGAEIEMDHGVIVGGVPGGRLRGARHHFPIVSVTGTENLMMAATLAEGTSEFTGCAREPEVVDLAELLVAMGARIEGAGTDRIVVEGVDELGAARHRVCPDRIVAGTYVVAAALSGEDVTVTNCRPRDMTALIGTMRDAGVGVEADADSVRVAPAGPRRAVNIRTEPHPGFPTDMQAQFMALATQCEGVTVIEETIFENRFMHVARPRVSPGPGLRADRGEAPRPRGRRRAAPRRRVSRRPRAADPVADIVKGWLVQAVRETSGDDPELFDRAYELYALVEGSGATHEPHSKLVRIAETQAFRAATLLLGRRAHHLFEHGLRMARENRLLLTELRRRLDAKGIRLEEDGGRARAVEEYERLLVETVPAERQLEDVEAVADTIELANAFLNPGSRAKDKAFSTAYNVLKHVVLDDPGIVSRADGLRDELRGDPTRLAGLAMAVRAHGPRLVREMAERVNLEEAAASSTRKRRARS
jgi:UDP-N-acetylglucosamine 1-carboxyvinyltransferase